MAGWRGRMGWPRTEQVRLRRTCNHHSHLALLCGNAPRRRQTFFQLNSLDAERDAPNEGSRGTDAPAMQSARRSFLRQMEESKHAPMPVLVQKGMVDYLTRLRCVDPRASCHLHA